MYDYVKRIGLDPRCYGLFSYLIIYLPCHWAQTTGYHLTAIKIGLYHIYPSTVNRSNFGRIWDVCIFFWLCQWIKVFLTSATLAYVSYPGRGFLSKSICWTSFLVEKFDHKLYYDCNKNPLENERVDQKIRPFMQAWRNEMKKRVYVLVFFWRQQLRHVHYILAGAFCLKRFVVHLFLVQKFAHNLDYIFQKTDWKMSELIKRSTFTHRERWRTR